MQSERKINWLNYQPAQGSASILTGMVEYKDLILPTTIWLDSEVTDLQTIVEKSTKITIYHFLIKTLKLDICMEFPV